ncbi:MAG: hypothetical protein EOL86_14285 [Deltaproteobacteria bacterium]|nr:hypothetical protein [Deltaproteobacteria bacterium]
MDSSFAGAGEMRARTSGHSIRGAAQNASGERNNRANRGPDEERRAREKCPAHGPIGSAPAVFAAPANGISKNFAAISANEIKGIERKRKIFEKRD